ncbi:MAG TPA: DUF4142 domain-containing protein [Longimicrobiaceae bacterium]|nr:DUF4142 domain-containing protein [Longimicrobiaceae bacterium]
MQKRTLRTALALCTLASAALGSGCAGMGARLSPQATGAHLNIMALNLANNRAEIAEGQLALTNASAPAVREFAQEMVTEHTANLQRQEQLMQQMGLTAETLMALPVARQMEENHRAAMAVLTPARGAPFDRAYMERQAAMHRYALETIDAMRGIATGGGTAEGAGTPLDVDVRGMNAGRATEFEQETRAVIAEHEQHAQQVRGTLGGAM